MRVCDVMTTPARVVSLDATLYDAVRAMWAEGVGALPVIDERGQLVGIVTDRDASIAAMIQEEKLADLLVANAMSPVVHSCHSGDSLRDAEYMMQEHGIRRLPVLDENEMLAGMLSVDDLAIAAARQLEAFPSDGLSPGDICATLAAVAAPRAQMHPALDHA